MATRGCIARVHGDGFRGVYNHWDSHPTTLGKDLYSLAHEQDLGDLLRGLIDEHPAGWMYPRNECICHGKNQQQPLVVTDQENSEWVQWAYALDANARTMGVFRQLGAQDWHLCAVVPLDGPAPNWRQIEAKGEAAAR